jgi:hypothetical protein
MDGPPRREFGKRHPALAPPASPPVKRSGHVALLLMGTVAVGGSAYALMPREDCAPPSPGMAAPAISQPGTACSPGSSSGSGGHGGSWSHWSRTNFFSSDSSSGHSSSGGSSDSSSGSVTRGGFGSFARAFSGHFSSGS